MLPPCEIYTKDINAFIPEYLRLSFSRVRLSAHRLKVETGRWARIPRDHRLCACGSVQDEEHVMQYCPLVQHIRVKYGKQSLVFPECLSQAKSLDDFKVINDILVFFE